MSTMWKLTSFLIVASLGVITVDCTCDCLTGQPEQLPTCQANQRPPFFRIGEKNYVILTNRMSWSNGRIECQKLKADLAEIQSIDEMNAISDYLISKRYTHDRADWFWISGTDAGHEGNWKYASGQDIFFFRWTLGQPDNAGGNENCMHLWYNEGKFGMNDWVCDQKAMVICESTNHAPCSLTGGNEFGIDIRVFQ